MNLDSLQTVCKGTPAVQIPMRLGSAGGDLQPEGVD